MSRVLGILAAVFGVACVVCAFAAIWTHGAVSDSLAGTASLAFILAAGLGIVAAVGADL